MEEASGSSTAPNDMTNKIPGSDLYNEIYMHDTLLWQLFVPSSNICLCYSYYHLTLFLDQSTVDHQFSSKIPSGSVTELTLYP